MLQVVGHGRCGAVACYVPLLCHRIGGIAPHELTPTGGGSEVPRSRRTIYGFRLCQRSRANDFLGDEMPGTPSRSGGSNRQGHACPPGDGAPEPPRQLSPRASAIYSWLLTRLHTCDDGAGWRRVDGALVAAVAELLESQERIASVIADDPTDLSAHRLRVQLAGQIRGYSSLLGLCPRDREKAPRVPAAPEDGPFNELLARMSSVS